MNITVYLASSSGKDPSLKEAVTELGEWIALNGHCLVYGGSRNGLMGVLSKSVKDRGGKVIGVEPRFFIEMGFVNEDLDELFITENMAQRKAKMIGLGDAFIALPGGTGTLEEIAEVMSLVSLGHLKAPCIVYNLNGYYNDLKRQLEKMLEEGLSSLSRQQGIFFADDLGQIEKIINQRGIK